MPDATFERLRDGRRRRHRDEGSTVCQYSFGSVAPPGHGLRRDVGMCVCSGNHSDSKPRSSLARARSSTRMA